MSPNPSIETLPVPLTTTLTVQIAQEQKTVGQRLGRALGVTVTGAFAGAIAVLTVLTLWIGREYYLLDRAARAEHELHDTLAAGGMWGVFLGFAGTALMLAMLLYTLRKKMPRATWLGSMSGWLLFHILCGIGGPIFILLHVGFAWPTGLVAIAFWCMVLVAASGAFGRWVYGLLPRSDGQMLDRAGTRSELADLHARLVAQTADVDAAELGEVVAEIRELEASARTIVGLLAAQRAHQRRRRRIRPVLEQLTELPRSQRAEARALLEAQLSLVRGLEASIVARRLLRYWHLFHRPLAGAMYVIVAVHVAGAVLFGGSLQRLSELIQ